MTSTVDSLRKNRRTGVLSVKFILDQREVGVIQSQQIVECYFIEDIFSNVLRGKLTFYDTEGMHEIAPLTGHEMITLVYGVEETREITFHIWRVANVAQVSEVHSTTKNIIELYFVDSSFYNMTMPKYSRSFSENTLHSDIIKHLLKNMVGWPEKDINIEKSSSKVTNGWVMPYWNVSDSISWLAANASSEETGASGYLCYNNTNESWKANLYTLNYLFGENNILDENDYIFEGDDVTTQNKILEWWINGTNKSTMKTVFGGSWRGLDTSKKSLVKQDWTFSDGVGKTTLLGRKSYFPDVSDVSCAQVTTAHSPAELQNTLYDDWVKKYSLQNNVNIIIEGNEKRYAGHQIRIKWPSINKTTQIYNKQLEGKYLVKSITHNFTGMGNSPINYMQRIVLIKNAFEDSASDNLIKATNMNITQKGSKTKSFLFGGY